MALQEADFDLAMLGFPDEELAHLMAGPPGEALCDPDEVPEPPEEPVTQPGDLWLLGRHRLLCGDATKAEDLARLLPKGKADLLLTDPPYNVAYEGKTAEALTIANDDMTPEAYRAFLASALSAAVGRLKAGGSFYLWHADTAGLDVRLSCDQAGLRVRQCLVWVKSVLVPGRQDYQWKHEPVLYGWAEGAAHTWLSDRAQTTVLESDKPAAAPSTRPPSRWTSSRTSSATRARRAAPSSTPSAGAARAWSRPSRRGAPRRSSN
jgi:site-specific DNA-methyltransferase (adenine-specific)